MRRLRLALSAVAAAALLASGVTAASSAAAAPTYNVITMEGAGHLTHGNTIFDPLVDGGTFTTSWNLEFHATRADGVWGQVQLSAPTSMTDFVVGHYDVQDFVDDTHASVSLGNNGAGCNATTGSLDVQQIVQSAGVVSAFAASYSVTCDGGSFAGVIRYNSTLGYQVGQGTPAAAGFGSVDEGDLSAVMSVVVTGRGPTPLAVSGVATINGPAASSFSVVADGCAGHTLAAGQTCTMSFQARPWALGVLDAVAVVPDGSAGGGVRIPLLRSPRQLGARGTFQAVPTARILDTRKGIGHYLGAVAATSTVHLKATGVGGVPAGGVSAVVLNLTETGATSTGYVTAYPAGTTRPTASSVNYRPGVTRANLVVAQVGAGGVVELTTVAATSISSSTSAGGSPRRRRQPNPARHGRVVAVRLASAAGRHADLEPAGPQARMGGPRRSRLRPAQRLPERRPGHGHCGPAERRWLRLGVRRADRPDPHVDAEPPTGSDHTQPRDRADVAVPTDVVQQLPVVQGLQRRQPHDQHPGRHRGRLRQHVDHGRHALRADLRRRGSSTPEGPWAPPRSAPRRPRS